jgi:hypothetical protein
MPLRVPFGAMWASFLLATSISAGNAASLTSSGAEGKTVLVLSGEITSGDTDRFLAEVKTAMNDRRVIAGVRLSSPGGDVGEGFKLARVVRDARMATIVPDGVMCASACFIVFAAGSEKFAGYAARVGVHGAASDRSQHETDQSRAATIIMARVVKELGVPPGIIGQMVVTPPNQMVWLSPDDLRSMGTTMMGRPEQTPSASAAIPQSPIDMTPPRQ